MAHNGTIRIKQHMIPIMEDFRDDCGEINATGLAEYVCCMLDGYDGDETPEVYFEVAGWLAVADENVRSGNMPAATRALVNARDASFF
jgi:hypothetical protein